MEDIFNLEELENLTSEEKNQVLSILKEMEDKGSSKQFRDLLLKDYDEIPVDIMEFITNPEYLGKSWLSGTGKLKLYPYWQKKIQEVFTGSTNNYTEMCITGAIGLGKTEIAVTCMLYLLYKVMCLKNPYTYFDLKETDVITFLFLNITMDLARGVAWQKAQEMLQRSPWFMARGTVSGRVHLEWQPNKNILLMYGSKMEHALGKAIFSALMDEASFGKGKSMKLQQNAMMKTYHAIAERASSRFLHAGGTNPTMMFIVSSKQAESDFLEQYIETVKGHKGTLIVDEPIWNVKPPETYSGKKFKVAVGNRYLSSEIIPDNENEESYLLQGYTILDVPIEYKLEFEKDIDASLMNKAGISSSTVMRFISGKRLERCYGNLVNPFSTEILSIGMDDKLQYKDFFKSDIFDSEIISKPIFIHTDTSLSGDITGMSAVAIEGAGKPSQQLEDTESNVELHYRHLFTIGIKAPRDSQISLEKNRQFIYYLKSIGWNIKGVSYDGFQSADSVQILSSKGYTAKVASLDKTPEGYNTFKAAINEQRITIIKLDKLSWEIVNLNKDNQTGKIDHDADKSKDLSDSLAGALWEASKYKTQYVYQYGEDLDTTLDLNNDLLDDKQQVLIDLKNALISSSQKKEEIKQEKKESIEPKPPENKPITTKPINPFSNNVGFGNNLDVYIPETISGDILVF